MNTDGRMLEIKGEDIGMPQSASLMDRPLSDSGPSENHQKPNTNEQPEMKA